MLRTVSLLPVSDSDLFLLRHFAIFPLFQSLFCLCFFRHISPKAISPLDLSMEHGIVLACFTLSFYVPTDRHSTRNLHPPIPFPLTDQVVHYNGRIREKPETPEMCRAYLKSYETEPACTVCGVVVTHMGTGRQATGVDVARQHFRPIPDDVAEALIAKGDVMYCCGGFLVDDPLIAPYLAEREGDEDSIIGMPMALTRPLIAEVIAPKQPA